MIQRRPDDPGDGTRSARRLLLREWLRAAGDLIDLAPSRPLPPRLAFPAWLQGGFDRDRFALQRDLRRAMSAEFIRLNSDRRSRLLQTLRHPDIPGQLTLSFARDE